MKASGKDRLSSLLLILFLALPGTLPAEERPGAAQRPEPRRVFEEILKPYRNLNDYAVKIRAEIDIPTIRVPEFTATLYFKRPDRFHVETRRFAPIPRNSGIFNPFLFDPGKNLLTYLRTENPGGTQADIYRVEPMNGKTPVRHYTVWVGGTPPQILQVESLSFQGTKALVKISHQPVAQGDEKWRLPSKSQIHLIFPKQAKGADTLITKDSPITGGMGRLDEMSGEGDITITYTDWRVNTGLDDGLFKDGKNR
jgi:hypothetical protein